MSICPGASCVRSEDRTIGPRTTVFPPLGSSTTTPLITQPPCTWLVVDTGESVSACRSGLMCAGWLRGRNRASGASAERVPVAARPVRRKAQPGAVPDRHDLRLRDPLRDRLRRVRAAGVARWRQQPHLRRSGLLRRTGGGRAGDSGFHGRSRDGPRPDGRHWRQRVLP